MISPAILSVNVSNAVFTAHFPESCQLFFQLLSVRHT